MFKKSLLFFLLISAISSISFAQSRVFKEVGRQISSKVEPIMQDNNLVGYILFYQLEQVNKDTFSYKLDFLDENLNDIGTYSFKDRALEIQDAVFDNDVLLIGYLRTDMVNKATMFNYQKVQENAKSSVYFQFLSLDGKMIKEVSSPVKLNGAFSGNFYTGIQFGGYLKNPLKLQNIPGKGFAYTYGDGKEEIYSISIYYIRSVQKTDTASDELVGFFNYAGEKIWEQKLPDAKSKRIELKATDKYLYLLRKTAIEAVDGGFEVFCLDLKNGNVLKKVDLNDNKDRQFEVLQFANAPSDNQPIISGTLINKKMQRTSRFGGKICHIKKPKRVGVFSLRFQDTASTFKSTIWDKDSKLGLVRNDGLLSSTNTYLDLTHSFSDINGNIFYAGSGLKKRTRWVSIGISIVTAPTLFIPYCFLYNGIFKYKYSHLILLKENKEGKLAYYTNMKYDHSRFLPGQTSIPSINQHYNKRFFSVNQNKYLVLNDIENIYIYNIEAKNIIKTIPHQKGEIISHAFIAKDGFIMISEYNSREKSTKLSIESL